MIMFSTLTCCFPKRFGQKALSACYQPTPIPLHCYPDKKEKREKPDSLSSPLALDQIEEPPSVETSPQIFKKGAKKIILSAESSPDNNVESTQHPSGETTDEDVGSQSAPIATATASKVQTGASAQKKTLTFDSAPPKKMKKHSLSQKAQRKKASPLTV